MWQGRFDDFFFSLSHLSFLDINSKWCKKCVVHYYFSKMDNAIFTPLTHLLKPHVFTIWHKKVQMYMTECALMKGFNPFSPGCFTTCAASVAWAFLALLLRKKKSVLLQNYYDQHIFTMVIRISVNSSSTEHISTSSTILTLNHFQTCLSRHVYHSSVSQYTCPG